MTTLVDRPNTALLVIDVQNDVVAAAHDRAGVLGSINAVVAKARAAGVPVIWVQHDDEYMQAETDGWQIVSELDPQPSEPIVRKHCRDSFEATDLDDMLVDRKVSRLVMVGAQTDFCVRWTLHGALSRGYDTVLIADAHTTDEASPAGMPSGAELVAHTNSVWGSQAVPDVSTSVTTAAELTL